MNALVVPDGSMIWIICYDCIEAPGEWIARKFIGEHGTAELFYDPSLLVVRAYVQQQFIKEDRVGYRITTKDHPIIEELYV